MNLHQSRHRTTPAKHLRHISGFGRMIAGSHPDVAQREFGSLADSADFARFCAAVERARDYSWRVRPSLIP